MVGVVRLGGRDGPRGERDDSFPCSRGEAFERIVFFGEYGHDADRLVVCETTGSGVEPVESARVVRPDGGPLGRRHVVSRDARVYVLEEPYTEWNVLDAGGAVPAS
ncbi:hypothetical protein ACFWOY_11360 [Streptomyces sp. NPDC058423]|uniref:hypothetical protein n=1 Tax=unclassified Streptomyces TaxID=2593676 RepID=UPI0036497CF5